MALQNNDGGNYMKINETIRKYRKEQNLKQEQIALSAS
jgi:hypothetical protein